MVKRTHDFEDFLRAERPPVMERRCDMPSCACAGEYRAPKARNRLNEYFWFCLDHVRAYNAQWDYYAGMSTVEIEAHLRADTLWHRPTWPLGGRQAKGPQDQGRQYHFRDPFGLFDDVFEEGPAARASAEAGAQSNPRHRPPPPQAKALALFDLSPPVSLTEVKARYKALVKQHHPDANGGDKAAEERLKLIIEAYVILRTWLVAS
jgi:hypothetical protein